MKTGENRLYGTVSARKGMKGSCDNCRAEQVAEPGDKLTIMPVRNRRGQEIEGRTCLKSKCRQCGHWVKFR